MSASLTEPDAETLRGYLLEIGELQRRGQLAQADARAEALLQAHPDSMALLVVRARAARLAGKLTAAENYLARALERAPQSPALLAEAGKLAVDAGRMDEALRHFRVVTQQQPRHANAWYNLGLAAEGSQRHREAIDAYRQALALGIAEPLEVETRLGCVLLAVNEEQAAARVFDRVLEQAPGHPQALYGRAMIEQALGDFTRAEQLFRRALEANPDFVEVYQQIAEQRRFDDPADPLIATLRGLLDQQPSAQAREKLHFALGKISNDCGDYDAAFGHFAEANRLKKARQPRFDREQHRTLTDAIIQHFDARWLAQVTAPVATAITPVFIVGMPRSGTTLVEQILASHSRVAGAGELPFMDDLARNRLADYPGGLAELPDARRTEMRDEYLRILAEASEGKPWVTDKFPSNFLHLGLIRQLLPEARFVHCRRDPMDNCLSVFIQDFGTGNYYANDLDDIAFYYRRYLALMAHWRGLFGDQLREVSYEQLIEDQAGVTRGLLQGLGLEWEESCLAFDKNPRKVSTLSRWQVRQPIYKNAAGRWRRYAKHLKGLQSALDYED